MPLREKNRQKDVEILEQGNIYFFFRPKKGEKSPQSLDDVQRFHLVLHPKGQRKYRLMLVGQKKMPKIKNGGRKFWGFVELVAKDPDSIDQELELQRYGERGAKKDQPSVSRAAGEGVYMIARHADHTHLSYWLELPKQRKGVQKELNIARKGSYILTIKNPRQPGRFRTTGRAGKRAKFPAALQKKFQGKSFYPANPPGFLDVENAQFVIIGAKQNVEKELGIMYDEKEEQQHQADIFNDLRIEQKKNPTEPLFVGQWK